jgi:hypothetical protein
MIRTKAVDIFLQKDKFNLSRQLMEGNFGQNK